MFINFFMEGRVELTLKDGPCFNGGGQLTSNFCFTTRES